MRRLIAPAIFATCLMAMPAAAQVTDRGTTPGTPAPMTDTRRDTDWGWLGLLGLVGLAGLFRNPRHERFDTRPATAR